MRRGGRLNKYLDFTFLLWRTSGSRRITLSPLSSSSFLFLFLEIPEPFTVLAPYLSSISARLLQPDIPILQPDIPISPHKKFTKPNITQPLNNDDFSQFFGHSSSLGLDRDLGFRVDDPCDFPDIPISPHKKLIKPNLTYQIFQMAINHIIFQTRNLNFLSS